MTLYYDSETKQIIENHPEDWMYFDDDGRFVIDLTELDASVRDRKIKSLLSCAVEAVEDAEQWRLTTKPDVEWVTY